MDLKKLFSSFFILLFFTVANAQEKNNKIGVVFSNNYSRLENLNLLNGQRLRASYRYGFGMNGNFAIAKNWKFEIGFMYSKRGMNTDKIKTNYTTQQPNDPAIPTHLRYKENFEFIDIPIKILRLISNKEKSYQFISIGLAPTLTVGYNTTTSMYYKNRIQSIEQFPINYTKDYNALFLLGYGYSFNLYKNMSLQLEMNVKRSIMNVYTEESKLNNHFWEAGLNTYLYWK